MTSICRSQTLVVVGQAFPWGYRVIRLLDGRPVLVMRLHGRRTWNLLAFMLEDLHLFREAVDLGFIQ